jgi:hypothetical protein
MIKLIMPPINLLNLESYAIYSAESLSSSITSAKLLTFSSMQIISLLIALTKSDISAFTLISPFFLYAMKLL